MIFKRVLFFSVLLMVAVLCAIWSPWERTGVSLYSLLDIAPPESFAGLEVYALRDGFDLSIDGANKGQVVASDGVFLEPQIGGGFHTIKLEKQDSDGYYIFEKTINFVDGFNVVVAYELGPSKEFSQGYIMYVASNSVIEGDNVAYLTIESAQDDVDVSINSQSVGKTPLNNLELDLGSTQILRFTKPGYEVLEFSILPEDKVAREKLKGHELKLETSLFLVPIDITNVE